MTHQKDFDGWSGEKKYIDQQEKRVFPKVRQIWFVKLGVNLGYESDGKGEFKRPVIVMAKIGNLLWCLPLTTKHKPDNRFYFKLGDISSAMLSQMRILDKKRFVSWIGTINKKQYQELQEVLSEMYFPDI